MAREYFPNNWQEIKDADLEQFDTCTFEEFMDCRVAQWQIPSSHSCIIRTENTKTQKIQEFSYQRPSAAEKKLMTLIEDPDIIVTIADSASIAQLKVREGDKKQD